MNSTIHKVMHDDGTFQRYQTVTGFKWRDVHYFSPGITPRVMKALVRLYDVNIIPKLKNHTGSYVFFHVPEDYTLDFDRNTKDGCIVDDSVLLAILLRNEYEEGRISLTNKDLKVDDPKLAGIVKHLSGIGMFGVSPDEGEEIHFLPVNGKLGHISERRKSRVVVDSHFFLMDPSDLDSPYCKVGTPYGLMLENGIILSPPLNHRPCLLVDSEEHTHITKLELEDLSFEIDGMMYKTGKNCILHHRPEERITPRHDGVDIVITEDKVIAVKKGGGSVIPVAGFVLSVPSDVSIEDNSVHYKGLDGCIFGTQVGPVMMDDGKIVDHLETPFYREGIDKVVYAPTVYPLPFEKARASRICIGSDKDGKPVLIWAEGEGKLGIEKEKDSTGATLLEMARFTEVMEYKDIVNLDGGGSANLIYEGSRNLKIADRLPVTNEECERPVPVGLYID